jgi:hypothetical protein
LSCSGTGSATYRSCRQQHCGTQARR